MRIFFASSIFLGIIMVFVFGALMYNINMVEQMISDQKIVMSNLESLKKDSGLLTNNLGELVNTSMPLFQENNSLNSTEQPCDNFGPGMCREFEEQDSSQNKNLENELPSQENILKILNTAPSIQLESELSSAIGKVAMAIYDDNTYIKVAAINMPSLPTTKTYKVWLSRGEQIEDVILLGSMEYEASSSDATFFSVIEGDGSDYRKIYISLSPDTQEDLETAPIILEGKFDDSVDFKVNLEGISTSTSEKINLEPKMNNTSAALIQALSGQGDLSSMFGGGDMEGISIEDLLKTLSK